MAGYSDTYGYGSGYGSYPAMDGNSAYPAVDGNSTGYPSSSGYEDDSILDAQYRSGSKDLNISSTSFSSPSVNRSAPTYGPLSPAPPGDMVHHAQTSTSREDHTRSSPKPTRGAYLHRLHYRCDYQTRRQYDLDRHQKSHFPSVPVKKFNCPRMRCGRQGEYGVDRKDHLREHLRKVHARDMPKLPRQSNRRGE